MKLTKERYWAIVRDLKKRSPRFALGDNGTTPALFLTKRAAQDKLAWCDKEFGQLLKVVRVELRELK